jgi:YhcH/YjgK/YiaL family protein
MILDKIENAQLYASINEGINKVLELAKGLTPSNYPAEKIYIDGDKVFVNVPSYETHAREGALTEAHRKYIDVMYMVEGSEIVYVKPTDKLSRITREYDPDGDALLADTDDDTTAVRLSAGMFLILFPEDAHAPACDPLPKTNVKVKKIIGKVLI